jgi:K+-sensing histidine kinase KdpD
VIEGYNAVLETSGQDPDLLKTFGHIVGEQTKVAINAVGKLGLVLRSGFDNLYGKNETAQVNVRDIVHSITQRVEKDETLSSMLGKRPDISVAIPNDFERVFVSAVPNLIDKALTEVLQNAVIHSQHGKIQVTLYESDGSAIIDIMDDGAGVPPGNEDLIFLRFFQGSNMSKVKRGHRGLGLGLYLARHIAEQHMGQLNFIRQGSKGGLFRFVWPISINEIDSKKNRQLGA